MSLEQIQKEGEVLLDEQFDYKTTSAEHLLGYLVLLDKKDGLPVDKIQIIDFINSRTILAYQAGEKAMLEKVLGEIEEKLSFYKEMMYKSKNMNRLSTWSDFSSKYQALKSLKEKLLTNK